MKAKGFDFKQFAVTHGEKIVLGLAGVLALLVLVKTTWGTYNKQTPSGLKKSAEDARALIANTKWPADESRKYPPDDTLGIKIKSMLTEIPGDKLTTPKGEPGLEFSISGTWPLYLRENPLVDPEYFPVRNLIATFFRPVIAKKTTQYVVANEGGEPQGSMLVGNNQQQQPKSQPGGFRPTKRGGTTQEGNPMAPGAAGVPPSFGGKAGFQRPGPMGPGGGVGGVAAVPPMGPGAVPGMRMPGMTGSGEMGGLGQAVEAEGRRAVAVRGIFPIRKQMQQYVNNLHLPDGLSPFDYIHIDDFVLQRAVSTDGGKTFGKWTAVDKKSNVEYLMTKVADFDRDIVATGVTHYIITSPLPSRLLRDWGDEATHPDLKAYRLSEQGRKRQRLINEAVVKQKKQLKEFQEQNRPKGFGLVQRNMVGERSNVLQNADASNGFDNYMRNQLTTDMGMGPGEGDRKTQLDALKAEATAVGDLVLFRYFDFDVLPGRTYKYRVKLVLRNPLFNVPLEKLALESQGSNKDEFRETPLSNETAPVTVKNDVDYFIDKVVDQRSPRIVDPKVTMTVYEWMQKLGTTVKGKVRNLEPGQMIAGTDSKTKRLDPAKKILSINDKSEFDSNSLVLDLQAGHPNLEDRHMHELGLPTELKNKIAAPDQVVVVDALGRIEQLDKLSMQYRFSKVDGEHKAMMAHFQNWEQDPSVVNQTVEGYPMEGGGDLDGPIMGKGRGKARRRGKRSRGSSPLRRGGYSPYGASGYGASAGYGPNSGTGGPGGGHGSGKGSGKRPAGP